MRETNSPEPNTDESHFIVGQRPGVNPFDPLSHPEQYSDWESTFNTIPAKKEGKGPHHKFKKRNGPHNERLLN